MYDREGIMHWLNFVSCSLSKNSKQCYITKYCILMYIKILAKI